MAEFYPGSRPLFFESIKDSKNKLQDLSDYENTLLKKIENGQKKEVIKINKDFYNNAISELIVYLSSNEKISAKFMELLIELLRIDDLDNLFRNGILSIKNKDILYNVFSKLLFEVNVLKVLDVLPLLKSIGLELYPDLELSLNALNDRRDMKSLLFKNFRSLLSKSSIEFSKIEIINFPNKIKIKPIKTLVENISNKTHDVLINRNLEDSKIITIAESQITKAKNTKAPKSTESSKRKNKISNSNKTVIQKTKIRKKIPIIDIKETKDIILDYTPECDFFSLLTSFRKTRRIDKKILPKSLYISFVKKSSDKDFFKLLDLDKVTISQTNLDIDILKSIFDRLINYSRKKIIELERIRGYINRVESIKNKIVKIELDSIYDYKYNDFKLSFYNERKIIKGDLAKEEKKKTRETNSLKEKYIYFSDSKIEDLSNKQSNIFFELLKEFRFGNRTDTKLISTNLYIAFIRSSNEEDFYKLLEIDKLTISNNNLSIEILDALFERLISLPIMHGSGKYLMIRINSIRGKILKKTNTNLLSPKLEKLYASFLDKYKKLYNKAKS